jgi:hypothetical protein
MAVKCFFTAGELATAASITVIRNMAGYIMQTD